MPEDPNCLRVTLIPRPRGLLWHEEINWLIEQRWPHSRRSLAKLIQMNEDAFLSFLSGQGTILTTQLGRLARHLRCEPRYLARLRYIKDHVTLPPEVKQKQAMTNIQRLRKWRAKKQQEHHHAQP